MTKKIPQQIQLILADYDSAFPSRAADALRSYWLSYVPKSIAGIKVEQRQMQETVGIPVPVLQKIGKEIAKPAKKEISDFIPLVSLLWNEYGREGRVVTVYPLGAMELADPLRLLPVIMDLCRSCITWEDADQLSMRTLEPVVRKYPATWLPVLEPWLVDENKWVRRAGIIAVGRLAMKHPEYTPRCLELAKTLLKDDEMDVKRATSFAIRLCARGSTSEVCKFMLDQVPPEQTVSTWVPCDVVRSMTKKFLPAFTIILPRYQDWAADPDLSSRDRRSIESALKTLSQTLENNNNLIIESPGKSTP